MSTPVRGGKLQGLKKGGRHATESIAHMRSSEDWQAVLGTYVEVLCTV